jgi:hypothetical protein
MGRRLLVLPLIGLGALVPALGCDSTDDAVDRGKKAAEKAADDALDSSKKAAGELADKATDKSKALADDALDSSKKTAGELAGKAKDSAVSWWDELPDSGELSDSASDWLDKKAADGGIEKYVTAGKQIAPAAVAVAGSLHDAVDSDTVVEPIFRPVQAEDAKVDAAIEDMPRTEVIDGLTVGFKQIDELTRDSSVKERGYLVMWRQGDHLVGFVYRSRREIDLDKVVAEAPKIIALCKATAAAL